MDDGEPTMDELDLPSELRSMIPTGRPLTGAERFHAQQIGLLAADKIESLTRKAEEQDSAGVAKEKRLKVRPIQAEQLVSMGADADIAARVCEEEEMKAHLWNECGEAGRWAVDEMAKLRNEVRKLKRGRRKD